MRVSLELWVNINSCGLIALPHYIKIPLSVSYQGLCRLKAQDLQRACRAMVSIEGTVHGTWPRSFHNSKAECSRWSFGSNSMNSITMRESSCLSAIYHRLHDAMCRFDGLFLSSPLTLTSSYYNYWCQIIVTSSYSNYSKGLYCKIQFVLFNCKRHYGCITQVFMLDWLPMMAWARRIFPTSQSQPM